MRRGSVSGFTLIELLVVLSIMGLLLAVAMPRLSAFWSTPQERELRDLDHFVLRASRRAVREPLVPQGQIDAKPLRFKIIPPQTLILLRADTELARFNFKEYRIDGIEQDGRPTRLEPEFEFNSLGLVPPFSIQLAGAGVQDRLRWQFDRLGGIRVEPAI